jgi:vitamin B12 transporter
MQPRVFRPLRAVLLATAATAVSAPVLAQTAPPDPAAQLEEVIVTASRREQPIEQLGGAVSVVSSELIEQQQLTSLDDIFEHVPGVTRIRSGGIGQNTQVRMRGFTTKHVLVMIDGVKLNNPSESDNQYGLEHIMLQDVERVEVLRGPQSGVYGGDASAGVINVITRRPQGAPEGRLSAMYGTEDTYQISAGSTGRVNDVGYVASASWYQTDGISLSSRAPGNVEPDGYENLTLNVRGDWDVSETLGLDGWVRYVKSENDVDVGSLAADNPEGLPPYLFQDSPGYTQNEQLFAFARARLSTLDGRLTHELKGSVVDMDQTYVTPGVEQDAEGRTTEVGYYGELELGSGAFLLGGVEHKNEDATFEQPVGSGYALINDSISETGVFATANLAPAPGLYLSGAVRYDDNSLFGGNTTYRLTGAYNLADGVGLPGVETKLRASYGTGAEAPGLRQLLGSSPTYQGNPDLTPESSWMWDVGFDQSLRNGLARWSVTYYEGEATDGIFSVFDPATGISSPQNVDSPVTMMGVEAEAVFQPSRFFDIGLTYTYNETEQQGAGVQLFGRPKHQASAYVTLHPTERLSLTVDGYWRDEFYSDYPTNYLMDGYALLNLSAAFDLTDRVRLNLNVHNVFDEFYEEKLGDSSYGRTAQVRVTARF